LAFWATARVSSEVKVTDRIGDNLGRIVAAWNEMFRGGTTGAMEAILDEKVVWEGVFPGEVCHNRDEVMGRLAHIPGPPRITRLEAEEQGDQVVVSVDGPDFRGDDPHRSGPRSIAFTLRGGRVIRMKSLGSRDEAFRLVGRA
jgi:hypothetical protein